MRRRKTPLPQAGEGAERSEAGEGQYGLELLAPVPGLAATPVRIYCTAAAAPIVTKRVSPPTVTKVKPISIAFSA